MATAAHSPLWRYRVLRFRTTSDRGKGGIAGVAAQAQAELRAVAVTSWPAVRFRTVTAPTTFRPPEQPAAAVAGSGTTVVETRVVARERTVTARRIVTTPQTVQVGRTVTVTDAPTTRTTTETQ